MSQDLFTVYANLKIDPLELSHILKGKTTPKEIHEAIQSTDFDRRNQEVIADALEEIGYPFDTIIAVLSIISNQNQDLAKLFNSV